MIWWKIPLPPKTANRQHGAKRNGGRFLLREMTLWRECVARAVAGGPRFHGGEYLLFMILCFPDKRRRDTSNYLKVVEDALQRAGVLDDDNRIVGHLLFKKVKKGHSCAYVALEDESSTQSWR